ncbi:hypothetical protein HAX54_047150, partial [Datura stramonium]|nr:hypothetical protein [Datura stramonium]
LLGMSGHCAIGRDTTFIATQVGVTRTLARRKAYRSTARTRRHTSWHASRARTYLHDTLPNVAVSCRGTLRGTIMAFPCFLH